MKQRLDQYDQSQKDLILSKEQQDKLVQKNEELKKELQETKYYCDKLRLEVKRLDVAKYGNESKIEIELNNYQAEFRKEKELNKQQKLQIQQLSTQMENILVENRLLRKLA